MKGTVARGVVRDGEKQLGDNDNYCDGKREREGEREREGGS